MESPEQSRVSCQVTPLSRRTHNSRKVTLSNPGLTNIHIHQECLGKPHCSSKLEFPHAESQVEQSDPLNEATE